VYLDVNNAALALATEECFERFQKKLVATAIKRLAAADHSLANYGEKAHKPSATDKLEIELELEPMEETKPDSDPGKEG
jgi:hypothetical protein